MESLLFELWEGHVRSHLDPVSIVALGCTDTWLKQVAACALTFTCPPTCPRHTHARMSRDRGAFPHAYLHLGMSDGSYLIWWRRMVLATGSPSQLQWLRDWKWFPVAGVALDHYHDVTALASGCQQTAGRDACCAWYTAVGPTTRDDLQEPLFDAIIIPFELFQVLDELPAFDQHVAELLVVGLRRQRRSLSARTVAGWLRVIRQWYIRTQVSSATFAVLMDLAVGLAARQKKYDGGALAALLVQEGYWFTAESFTLAQNFHRMGSAW